MSGLASRCAARLALAALTLGLTGFAHIRTCSQADAPAVEPGLPEVPIHVPGRLQRPALRRRAPGPRALPGHLDGRQRDT
ncbi:MAG: hypothetical protein R3F43_26065 [bacterium]